MPGPGSYLVGQEEIKELMDVMESGHLSRYGDMNDPAFKQNFPWFEGARYWEEHIQALREQIALIGEPALRLQ